jgi:hypothetical protein
MLQMVTQAARHLTTTSQAISNIVYHVRPGLRSTNVPLHLHIEDAYRPVQELTAIPPFTEHTPRMVQLDIGVGLGASHECIWHLQCMLMALKTSKCLDKWHTVINKREQQMLASVVCSCCPQLHCA